MTFRKYMVASVLAVGVVFATAPISAYAAKTTSSLKALDTDNDGTVSLDEAQKAAAAKFDALDADKDGTVDKTEAKGLMSKKAFGMSDPDKDGTIDKTEYAAAVEAAFKKADPDGDGTLDAKELSSGAGKKLLKIIQ